LLHADAVLPRAQALTRPFDIRAAKAAGALAIAALWGPGERGTLTHAGADRFAASPADVLVALTVVIA
jgi:phosphoglycolate phosphatase-like HAD superfamily hydrolase